MNREILFKAKRKDNGEWVEGYYLNIAKINRFICTGKIKLDGAVKGIIAPEMYEIDPDTLCQYTGLTDKNGQKIWENDILKANLDESYPEDITYIKILWDEYRFCTNKNYSTTLRRSKNGILQNIFKFAEIFLIIRICWRWSDK